jgi:hypothetical protein
MRRPLMFPLCALTQLVAAMSSAAAGTTHAIALVGHADSCPTRQGFTTALRAIFPDVTITIGGGQDDLRVELVDVGSHYRVVAGTIEREFIDTAMQCDERARNAAVFVALVLEPPTVDAPVIATRADGSAAPAVPTSRAQIELAALSDLAPSTGSNQLTSTGAQVRFVLGVEHIAATAGVAVLSPSSMMLQGVRARLTRVPIDLGVRGRIRRGDFGLSIEGGVAAAVQVTRGLDTPSSNTETRLELGGRLAVAVEYKRWKHVAPMLGLQAEVIPESYDLVWPTLGVVGTTPKYWIGAVAGVALPLW